MSFLTRLASTREGAEKLMNAELLSRLAECDYLGARPLEEAAPMGAFPLSLGRITHADICRHQTSMASFLLPPSVTTSSSFPRCSSLSALSFRSAPTLLSPLDR
jgi:hypothetical protein